MSKNLEHKATAAFAKSMQFLSRFKAKDRGGNGGSLSEAVRCGNLR
jgi:hypothetical protein